ncbi:MAG: class I SAM-dependent methyltransferase, partial [Verrucomicrobiia bacterium]
LGVLEIGALFGINLAIIYNSCVTRFDSIKVISLDPLEGYYGTPVDIALNMPVNPETFRRNMLLSNVPTNGYKLIQHYSTDPDALKAAQQEKITLLIIDGDHSYTGVKFDYVNYFSLLEPGGYVIFDDYNVREWPDVKDFVDEIVNNDTDCEVIGAFSRSFIGRKKLNQKGPECTS